MEDDDSISDEEGDLDAEEDEDEEEDKYDDDDDADDEEDDEEEEGDEDEDGNFLEDPDDSTENLTLKRERRQVGNLFYHFLIQRLKGTCCWLPVADGTIC